MLYEDNVRVGPAHSVEGDFVGVLCESHSWRLVAITPGMWVSLEITAALEKQLEFVLQGSR
jgi:hypothetical protein